MSDRTDGGGWRSGRPPEPPGARREPLPFAQPKPHHEDPDAPERVRRLMESPSYRRADLDPDFLQRDELRPTRLQLEFLKPELALIEHGIRATIVVFGGTRIVEPEAAAKRLAEARAAAEANPGDPELARRAAVCERIAAKSHYYEVAREFSRIVGRAGQGPGDCRLVVMTGGGPGIMEAGNRGAYDVGAKSIGLNINLPHEQYPNPYITPELCFQFRYFALRKMHFLKRARALVAFPGGYGTFDELFETLCLIQTRTIEPVPVVLVGESFWRRAFDAEFLAAEGVIDPEDTEIFWFAETAEEIWRTILEWYRRAGRSIFDDEGA
ncbi:MAG: LOG family protein [Acidobacteria bacterium]|nr:MAG: LOG family protein [Acidobacteriota bacterium]